MRYAAKKLRVRLGTLVARFVRNYYFRSVSIVYGTFAASCAFFAYTSWEFVREHSVWYSSQVVWFALLAAARCVLLWQRKRGGADMCGLQSMFLVLLGIELMLLSFVVYRYAVPMILSFNYVVVGGCYILVKLFVSLGGRRNYREHSREGDFICCKKQLSRAENLFLFNVLFNRLIAFYGWKDPSLRLSNLMAGCLFGILVLFAGFLMLLRGRRRLREQVLPLFFKRYSMLAAGAKYLPFFANFDTIIENNSEAEVPKMAKIAMKTPIVEMDGDEMTRVLWQWIKEDLILPYVDLKTEYYDLGLVNRDKTDDRVTVDAAEANKKYGVGVKCATITPNAQRVEEYKLKQMWKSPNGTIRRILDGTVFRAPILAKGITPYIPGWKKPIVLARHAYGDVYSGVETRAAQGEKAYLVVEDEQGNVREKLLIQDFKDSDGIVQSVHNLDKSIASFARACFNYALDVKMPLWFATKDTISKKYDHHFKDIFAEIFEREYKEKFAQAGIEYMYTLIDDAVARVVRSEGGLVWACKNYDGDVMSDMVATAYGSLGLMTSVLVSPEGNYEFEAAHGTVTRHYYKHLKGEETSTNSVATIFAWTGALAKRGELDNIPELVEFAKKLERATVQTIEEGEMTGDLISLFHAEGIAPKKLSSREFLLAVKKRLDA